MNRKDIFMSGFRSKLTYPFNHKDLAEFETIINFYEKENQKYKEVINKIYEITNYEYDFYDSIEDIVNDLENILKEVKDK